MHSRLIAMMLAASSLGGGGGGGSGTIWDDPFNSGSAIDTTGSRFASAIAWTKFAGGGGLNSDDIISGEWRLGTGSSGFYTPRGAYQSISSIAGDWQFVADCHMASVGIDELIGIYLRESSTNKDLIVGMGRAIWFSGGPQELGFRVANQTTKYTHTAEPTFTTSYDFWMRVTRTSGTLSYDYSLNSGGSWSTPYTQAQTIPFTTAPDQIGVCTNNTIANNGTTYGYFRDWKRTA